MREIIAGHYAFIRREIAAGEAKQVFANNPYKLELVEGLERGGVDEYGEPTDEPPVISTYQQDCFIDLCRGPHLDNTGQIPADAFRLLTASGAYWRGNERNAMLQRIYGVAFPEKAQLESYLSRLKEGKQHDHRTLGTQLGLYSIEAEDVGTGLVLWHPKGGLIRHLAERFCRDEHLASGYDFVYTPHIGRADLWKTSGHLEYFADKMYAPIDIEGQKYYLKPMNCPFHVYIYKSRTRSYRDLPLRFAEWGTVYRYEKSGAMHGLERVRGFTQDDAHLFCRADQMPAEIDRVLDFCLHILRSFGITEFQAFLATRDPEKSPGDVSMWDAATEALRQALLRAGIPFVLDEGEAAFYGPKIDLKMDALEAMPKRDPWQLSTIQFDFYLPVAFDLTYIAEDGTQQRPYMIHRALMGSMERFFGVLIEHYRGAFPVWLSPVQVIVLPIADRHTEFAQSVLSDLHRAGLRVEVDDSTDRVNAKIRNAQLQKIPYMLVVGDREAAQGSVNLRLRTGEQRGDLSVNEFLAYAQGVIARKELI
jgi:threonyl-tRNA synthetase